MANVLEIEIDNARNGGLHFLPLGRDLRGRYDPARDPEVNARLLLADYPHGVPGQRLGFDPDTGAAYVADALHDAEHKALREKLARKGFALPPEKEELAVQPDDRPSWVYWMRRAVEAGHARLTRGKFPDRIEGKVKKSFVLGERPKDPRDEMMNKLVALLYAALPADKRRAVDELLAGK
jgi:hypothetical protein